MVNRDPKISEQEQKKLLLLKTGENEDLVVVPEAKVKNRTCVFLKEKKEASDTNSVDCLCDEILNDQTTDITDLLDKKEERQILAAEDENENWETAKSRRKKDKKKVCFAPDVSDNEKVSQIVRTDMKEVMNVTNEDFAFINVRKGIHIVQDEKKNDEEEKTTEKDNEFW